MSRKKRDTTSSGAWQQQLTWKHPAEIKSRIISPSPPLLLPAATTSPDSVKISTTNVISPALPPMVISTAPLYVNFDSTVVPESLLYSAVHFSNAPFFVRINVGLRAEQVIAGDHNRRRVYIGRVHSQNLLSKHSACISWHMRQTIRVNDVVVPTERFRLADVTCALNSTTCTLDVCIDPVPVYSRAFFFVIFGRPLDVIEACEHIRQASRILNIMNPPPQVPYPAVRTGDGAFLVKLRDGRGKLLRIPCRTIYCRHANCFDLMSCVEAVGPLLHLGITCPICSSHALGFHVVIDEFVENILVVVLSRKLEGMIPEDGDAWFVIKESRTSTTPRELNADVEAFRRRPDAESTQQQQLLLQEEGESIWAVRADEEWVSQDIKKGPIMFLPVPELEGMVENDDGRHREDAFGSSWQAERKQADICSARQNLRFSKE